MRSLILAAFHRLRERMQRPRQGTLAYELYMANRPRSDEYYEMPKEEGDFDPDYGDSEVGHHGDS